MRTTRPKPVARFEVALTRRPFRTKKQGRTGAVQARAERLLARVLEYYGDQRRFAARRTAPSKPLAPIRDFCRRRSWTRRGAASRFRISSVARSAVERALSAGMSGDDVVYPALWLQLLESEAARAEQRRRRRRLLGHRRFVGLAGAPPRLGDGATERRGAVGRRQRSLAAHRSRLTPRWRGTRRAATPTPKPVSNKSPRAKPSIWSKSRSRAIC